MIPHQLRFHGIRDYVPTSIDLSGMNEHILISGPNGSGKSTITFCMGAVLRSGKVAIEGLRSNNLPEKETWRGAIHFLFKNEGKTRIDAPPYIQFSLDLEQLPGGPIKQVYRISEGDDLNQLETKEVYRSGGQPGFSEYRRELLEKYKIFPDHYYLIWYQQQVNQFATMSPEERFRIFSEMHNITNIQKNFEQSLERVKESEASVIDAETKVNIEKFKLYEAKTMYERFKKNREAIETNGTTFIRTLHALIALYQKEYKRTNRLIDQLTKEIEEQADFIQSHRVKHKTLHLQKEEVIKKKQETNVRLSQEEKTLDKTKQQEQSLDYEIKKLNEQLHTVREKQKRLRFTEEETKTMFEKNNIQIHHKKEQLDKIKQTKTEIFQNRNQCLTEKIQLESDLKSFDSAKKQYEQVLREYKSSHAVKEKINQLNEQASQQKETVHQLKIERQETSEQLQSLTKNQIISKRQEDVLKYMKRMGVRAYTFQSLLELKEGTPIEAEKRLNAIKYTIFYDEKHIPAINDLYHVSLRSIIPTGYLGSIPELQLQVKKGLSGEKEAFALRALWWVHLFIKKEAPYLENGQLIDARGSRGSQEYNTYLLSEQALTIQKKQCEKRIAQLDEIIPQLEREEAQLIEDVQHLHGKVHEVIKAEAFQLTIPSFKRKREQLQIVKEQLQHLDQEEQLLYQSERELQQHIAELNYENARLQEDLAIYEQLGALKETVEYLAKLEEKWIKTQRCSQSLERQVREIKSKLRHLQNEEIQLKQDMDYINSDIIHHENNQTENKRQRDKTIEQKEQYQGYILKYEQDLLKMKEEFPTLYQQVSSEKPLENQTRVQLTEQYIQAEQRLDVARNEKDINPEAEKIYKKMKETYEKNKSDLEQLKGFLKQNKARAEEIEQNLMTSIQMKVIQIHQLFQSYMNEFQFECEVSFDKYEEKNGRINFRLFIKVRKQGHRGKMEDVSIKARAGRVGKGVSGGEESLSSLLFALALLQELDTNPSFIVLDEFDSALDEGRKAKVFELYAEKLQRKLIIISPKGHDNDYLNHFYKAYITKHNPSQLKSSIVGIRNQNKVVE